MNDHTMRAIENKATDVPWLWDSEHLRLSSSGRVVIDLAGYEPAGVTREVDAEFITAARTWVPDALDRLDEVRALHRSDNHATRPLCTECRKPWPCDTKQTVDSL